MSGESNLDELRAFLNDPRQDVLLEAKDAYGVWYPAKVIAFKNEQVRVHFCNWSSRYDTWYSLASDCVRIRKPSPTPVANPKTPPVNNNSNHSSRVLPVRRSLTSSDKTFEPGAYVMALWRNQYEYLAEVLAFRCRQNEKAEYRLRFVWDNVIEWTAASRIRKASQSEIDYVLKFCREHGGPGSGRPLTTNADAAPTDLKSHQVTGVPDKLSSSRTQPSRRESVSTRAAVAAVTAPVVQSTDPVHPDQKNTTFLHGFDGVEQDGMLYDKAVIQFHEACRKRRELKRQAIENGQPPQSVPHSTAPNSSLLSASAQPQIARKTSSNPDTKPIKSARIAEPNSLPTPLSSPSGNIVPNSTGLKFPANQTARSPTQNSPKLFKTPTDSPKTDPSTTSTPDSGKSVIKPAQSASSSPTTYPCPHCPRILRHSKLLAAHLANYHKDCCEKKTDTRKSCARSPPPCAHHLVPVKTEPTADTKSPVDHQTDEVGSLSKPQAILLTCQPCNTRGVLPQAEPGMIQCDGCLCWSHQACYPPPTNTSARGRSFFYCSTCLLRTQSSRVNDTADLQRMAHTSQLPWCSSSMAEQRNHPHQLVGDVSDLLNWSHKLQSLLHSGWTVLHQTRLPDPSPKKRGLAPCGERLATPSAAAAATTTTTQHEPTLERASNEEQVKRLYMEFRASVVQGSQSVRQSSHGSFPDPDDHPTSFTNSLPDSAPCWSIAEDEDDEDADPSAIDANLLDSHVLNGFLQDLGPNVISELVDLGDATESAVNDGACTPEEADMTDPVLDHTGSAARRVQFGDADNHAVMPVLSDSTPDTPTKGLGLLLTSAHGMSSLFQATLTNSFPAVADSRTGLIPTSVPVSHQSEPTHMTTTVSPCLSSTPDTKRLPTTLTSIAETQSSSALCAVPDLFEPQLSSSSLNHSMTPPPESSANDTVSISLDRASASPCHLNPSSPLTVSTSAAPTIVDWLPLHKTIPKAQPPDNSYDLLQLPKVDPMTTSSTASIMYDTSFNLDTIMTDVLTPDTICEAQSNLDYLDEYILAPLERALFIMESQLDTVTEQLALLEHPPDKTADHGRSRTAANCSNHSLFSDGSSPFGSSSSFSLSPAAGGPLSGESPVFADPTAFVRPTTQDASNAVRVTDTSTSHSSVKQSSTARRLYEYTISRRSGHTVPTQRP